MTVLPKPSAMIKKAEINELPLVEKNNYDEEKVEIYPNQDWPRYSTRSVICLTLMLLAILGFFGGLILCREMLQPTPIRRFQGYCAIPIETDYRECVCTHVAQPGERRAGDVQLVSAAERDDEVDALREQLDLGDSVEKISVINNGRRVNFIHDFTDNTSGIVDEDRCFLMELQPEMVLTPELFISGLQSGVQFDVSRARSELRAALPALNDLRRYASRLAAHCVNRPVYRLVPATVIRKRSADDATPAPAHDYIQFAGKHVQEITIDNLAEVLEYEKLHKA